MIIACDIGGVVKNLTTDDAIDDAIVSVLKLAEKNTIIFISKCKKLYEEKTKLWLIANKLDHFKIYFCEDYEGKIKIAEKEKVEIMIDDKIQVLVTFPKSILKIWFCNDQQKINGTIKYQPDFFASVSIAKNWCDVMEILDK
jgi:uncharacterized HAD superfamily protein